VAAGPATAAAIFIAGRTRRATPATFVTTAIIVTRRPAAATTTLVTTTIIVAGRAATTTRAAIIVAAIVVSATATTASAATVIVVSIAPAALTGGEVLDLSAECRNDNFGRIPIVAVIVLPLAGLKITLDVDLIALLDVLLDEASSGLVEDRNGVPFGLLLALTGAFVTPGLTGRDPKVHDLSAVVEAPALGVSPDVADKDDLVH